MARYVTFKGPPGSYKYGSYHFKAKGTTLVVGDEEAADYLLSLPGFDEASLKKAEKRAAVKADDGEEVLEKGKPPEWPAAGFKNKADVIAFAGKYLELDLDEKVAKKTLQEDAYAAYVERFGHPDGEGGVDAGDAFEQGVEVG